MEISMPKTKQKMRIDQKYEEKAKNSQNKVFYGSQR